MRLHRFFIEEQLNKKEEVSIRDKELLHQWKKVFRLEKGDKVILLDSNSDSGFEYEAEFLLVSKDEAALRIISSRKVEFVPKREITLFQSLIKKDHFEMVLEKGTELGVSRFVPVLSERSEKKDLNMERARKILKEASEQSGKGVIPEISEVIGLKDIFTRATGRIIAFDPQGEHFDISKHSLNEQLSVLIGPEGGWSDKELEFFREKGIEINSLGDQVLRAETAAIAVSSLLLL